MIIDAIGSIAGILGVVGFVPQVIKTVKTKHTKDLSLGWLSIAVVSLSFWVTYGIAKQDMVIILGNGTLLALVLIVTGYKIKYG